MRDGRCRNHGGMCTGAGKRHRAVATRNGTQRQQLHERGCNSAGRQDAATSQGGAYSPAARGSPVMTLRVMLPAVADIETTPQLHIPQGRGQRTGGPWVRRGRRAPERIGARSGRQQSSPVWGRLMLSTASEIPLVVGPASSSLSGRIPQPTVLPSGQVQIGCWPGCLSLQPVTLQAPALAEPPTLEPHALHDPHDQREGFHGLGRALPRSLMVQQSVHRGARSTLGGRFQTR